MTADSAPIYITASDPAYHPILGFVAGSPLAFVVQSEPSPTAAGTPGVFLRPVRPVEALSTGEAVLWRFVRSAAGWGDCDLRGVADRLDGDGKRLALAIIEARFGARTAVG